MLPGAGVCRAIGVIAAALLFVASASAQDDAARMVDKFARDGERAETRKAEAARKSADAVKKKEDARKAKQSEVRREAEAQHARALARRKAEEAGADEAEMLARTEARDLEVTAETRQLIEEAEAARRRVEETLAQDATQAPQVSPPSQEPAGGFEKRLSPAEEDAERRAREMAAAKARAAAEARIAARRAADHRHRIEAFSRVHKVRSARLQARERRIAEEREAQRQRDEVARAALARAAEARRSREALARANKLRQQHATARARALERAESERQLALVLAAEQARAEAERTAAGPPMPNVLGGEEPRRSALDHANDPPATRSAEQAQAEAERIVVAPPSPLPFPQGGGEEGRDGLTGRAPVEAEQTRPGPERAAQVAEKAQPAALPHDEGMTRPVTGVDSKALGPPAIEEPATREAWAPPARREVAGSDPYPPRADATSDWNGQVTVLLIMAPGNYGIRRGNRTADPILCTIEGCYVSTGPHAPALFLPGRKAIGIGNTFGRRAGACQHRLGCIFRGVAFDYPGMLQPVDLHILKHDRRRPEKVLADSNCAITAGQLVCRRPVRGEGFIMWVLPDRLAERAGPELLERALYGGLDPLRSAEVGR